MSVAMILSSAALSISLIITAIKLIDGFVRADPRALIRIGTWLLCLIAVASLPCLIVLLIYQQWALAMMLGAGMLIVLTLLNWRSILARANFQPMWTEPGDVESMRGGPAQPAPDAELARRAAIVLEIAATDQVSTDTLAADALDSDWRDDMNQTRSVGNSWLARRSSALLGVPSGPSPESLNYLFNPLHPDAKEMKVEWCKWIKYDKRLFHIS